MIFGEKKEEDGGGVVFVELGLPSLMVGEDFGCLELVSRHVSKEWWLIFKIVEKNAKITPGFKTKSQKIIVRYSLG